MAPGSFFLLSVVLVAVSTGASVAMATDALPPASAADSGFLRACCANTTNAFACYDALLPHASSFHGNPVRVARAATATAIAFARLRGFRNELLRLPPGATGVGRVVDAALRYCAVFPAVSLGREGDTLAELRRLETAAGRGRGEQARWDLDSARIYLSSVGSSADSCVDDLESVGDAGRAALASPVGKQVVAWVASVRLYANIALDLVAVIKLGM